MNLIFSDDSKVYQDEQDPWTHFIVLTDINGTRHYACVLTTYVPYFATEVKSFDISLL